MKLFILIKNTEVNCVTFLVEHLVMLLSSISLIHFHSGNGDEAKAETCKS